MTGPSAAARPLARGDVFCQEVADGCVLYDPEAEQVYVFNATAAFIWTCCDGEHGVDEIAAELAESIGAGAPDRERLRGDVESALGEFRRLSLLAGAA